MMLNMGAISGREGQGMHRFGLRLILGKIPSFAGAKCFSKKEGFAVWICSCPPSSVTVGSLRVPGVALGAGAAPGRPGRDVQVSPRIPGSDKSALQVKASFYPCECRKGDRSPPFSLRPIGVKYCLCLDIYTFPKE